MLGYIGNKFKKIEDKNVKITSDVIKEKYKTYCESQGTRYQFSAFNTQIKKIGIEAPKQVRIKNDDGSSSKKYCYKINTHKLQEEMRRFLRDDEYVLDVGANRVIEEVDEGDVIDFKYGGSMFNNDLDDLDN